MAQAIVAFLLHLFIRLIYVTNRKERDINPAAAAYMDGTSNGIFAFWHGRMMTMSCFSPPKRNMRILISLHRDGLLISKVISHFGQETVSGSTSRGGKEAAAEILRALEQGDNIGITPDGPRGPAYVASRGIISLARLSQKPIIPVTIAYSRARHLNTWDKFALALPFGKIVFCAGKPIFISESDDEEILRLQFEQAMNALVEKAEGLAHG